MEKHPLISVIIPTFNRHRFIVEAVESVLSQEIDDLEVIVVDDGSTDGTRHLLEPYQQEIRYVYQDNQGVSAARNHGVRESRGEWLAFLDSDDRWVSGQLKARLEAAAGEDVFSFGGVEWFVDNAEDRHLLGQSESVTWPHCDTAGYVSDPVLDVAEGCYLHLGTLLCRKSAFLDVGWFDTGLCMGEDEDWFSRASLKKKFRYTPETVLCRRFHPGQISQEREESLRSLITVFARIRERTAGVHPQAYAAAGKRLAAKWSHLANRLATEARGSEAVRAVRAALSLEPSNMKYLLKLVLLSGRGLAGDAMMRHAYMLFCKALRF
ncbi:MULTISPECIES: glycosyltransferase family 2 protein [Methylomicrobium]|uniref:Glycosyl transferase n=1 Tax=Methylomicrobium album BG8 TaxID=686340 RepID=H8GM00_METAL|nr:MULTISPECIES: glycosyltransferase [Methylomicrobium]EIC28196.1 glycosyl transferase [Methylomicrobium album BG8]